MALVGHGEQLCEKILIPVFLNTQDATEIIQIVANIILLPCVYLILSGEGQVRTRFQAVERAPLLRLLRPLKFSG